MVEDVKELSNNQSTGVTEQSCLTIHEITSSLEEIDKSSKQTMQKAQTLGEVAKQTREKGNLWHTIYREKYPRYESFV